MALHDFQNQLSTELVSNNVFLRGDLLSLEAVYTHARYYNQTYFSIRNEFWFHGLYQMNFRLNLTDNQFRNGEQLLTTQPTARLACQCSKKLYSEVEVGYEGQDYAGNSQQTDYTQVFANLSIRYRL